MVSRARVEEVLQIYAQAWTQQDPQKILTIFTPDAIYCERAFEEPYRGHTQIKAYWQSKVVEEQKDIEFELLNIYIEGDVAIVEWDATFYNNAKQRTIHIREVAILEFENEKIKSLREYWHSK